MIWFWWKKDEERRKERERKRLKLKNEGHISIKYNMRKQGGRETEAEVICKGKVTTVVGKSETKWK